ncbi:MAG: 4-hydroxy-tetrahydrodipicolinate synthase [Duncaniella sp.]|nr:4-hydroxy-tetrahydrodipicolinate synthase [Duncaniella sp.]
MARKQLRGMGVALTTPFTPTLEIDYEALGRHLDFLIEGGADFIVALGTTAETPTLTEDEKEKMLAFIMDRIDGRVPLVVGMGGNSTRALTEIIRKNEALKEADAILSVVPYYNKPTQEGIYRHFAEVAKVSPVPVILYNIPGRTGVNMEVDTVIRLVEEFPGKISGIKEASGNMSQAGLIMTRRPQGFTVLSGDDSLAHTMIGLGGDGVISVVGNALPKEFTEMIKLSLDPETHDSARTLHSGFSALYSLLFKDGNPAGIKALLHEIFPWYGNCLRLPLVEATPATTKALAAALAAFRAR